MSPKLAFGGGDALKGPEAEEGLCVEREGLKITERIHLVKAPLGETFTGVYLLLGKEIVLIDTGLHKTPEEKVFPYLEQLGRSPSEIALVVLTHGHGDHYEGIPAVKKVSGAKVAVHKADAWLIEEDLDAALFRSLHEKYPDCFRPVKAEPYPKADLLLKEGESLNLAGEEYQVLEIPGHTDGSIGLYQPQQQLLFTGDAVSGDFLHFYGDPDRCIASDQRLLGLKVELLLASHRYKPASDAVLRGAETGAFIQRHIEAIQDAMEKTKEFIRASQRPVSPRELAEALQGPSLITAIKLLENLVRKGEASEVKAETRYW